MSKPRPRLAMFANVTNATSRLQAVRPDSGIVGDKSDSSRRYKRFLVTGRGNLRPACLFCETPVRPRQFSPFAPCPKCRQWRQVVYIKKAAESPYIGGYLLNYYVDVEKRQGVIEASDGVYRFPLPKRKDAFALERMLHAACSDFNLDYISEDTVKGLVENAVDSYWHAMRNSRSKLEAAQA